MASSTPPNIDADDFESLFAAYLVTLKQNYDNAGNLRGAIAATRIPQFFTAEYGNFVDDMLRKFRGRLKGFKSATEFGAVLDGVADDTVAIQAALDEANTDGAGIVIIGTGTPNHTALTMYSGVRLLHVLEGTPEGNRIGSAGDLAIRLDGGDSLYRKTGTNTTAGWTAAIGDSVSGGGGWIERYLADFAAAPSVDLATGTNPTVVVDNDTSNSGQVASCTWTSNFGDANSNTAMGTVTTFQTDGSTGLEFEGASTTSNFNATSQQAPHIFADWADVLGTDPEPGLEYCLQIRIVTNTIATNQQAVIVGSYTENDGSAPTDITSNTAKIDEKRLAASLEQNGGVLSAGIREGSTDFTYISGARLPATPDVVALIFRSGVMVEAAIGTYSGGFPEPQDMTRVDTWLGAQQGFTSSGYLDLQDRIAIAFQQQNGSSYDATVSHFRVLSRGG